MRGLVSAAAWLVLSAASGSSALAQSYALAPWTVAGGGTTASGGGAYGLGLTIGQHAAGAAKGGPYGLSLGLWSVTTAVEQPTQIIPTPEPTATPTRTPGPAVLSTGELRSSGLAPLAVLAMAALLLTTQRAPGAGRARQE